MNNEQILLDIQKLTISIHTHLGDVKVVEGIDFRVPVGSSVGLVGESGSGKSMTALAVMRLLPRGANISAGSIYFDGEELLTKEEADMEKIRGKKISMIFQSSKTALNPLMTVGDQIARVYELRLGLPRRDAWKKTVELLAAVGISKPDRRARSFAHHLSGGMAQRVMIGLMLACEPQLLIADEPTTGLDVTTEAQILDLIQEMRQTHSITLLLITHDLGLVANNCDLVGVMHAGHLVEYCPVHGLFNKPKHPYTQMFLSSIPRPDRDELSNTNMVGQAPSLLDLPAHGCRFVMRCPFRMERCNQSVPWVEVEPNHKVFCHLFSDGL